MVAFLNVYLSYLHGVSQGSVLDSVVLIIYGDELHKISNIKLFADDIDLDLPALVIVNFASMI